MKILRDRIPRLQKICKDEKVLDVGCVDHSVDYEKDDDWLHKNIREVANECLGIDILQEEVQQLNDAGYKVLQADACTFKYPTKFDVIVVGETIEHVGNPQAMLENLRDNLKTGGKMIITTPNSYAFRYALRNVFGDVVPNEEHTMYFDKYTLTELVSRVTGLNVYDRYFFHDPHGSTWKYYVEHWLSIVRDTWSPRLMFVLEKSGDDA